MRSVPMLDLRREYELYRDEARAAVDVVLESQQFILGPWVGQFEQAIQQRFGVSHAIAVSSGTDALLCAMMALGIGRDDEVIVPSFTFFATAGAVARLGAKPVFVDIDSRTFNLDPSAIEARITSRTRAIVAVHLFGQCADMDPIVEVARRRGLSAIEDAAQAIGARHKGRFAGTLGHVACLSFYPTKNLGGFGEGGMVLTQDESLASVCRRLRHHGESTRYHHDRVGGNFRLDSLKCALLSVKLRHLDSFTRRRREIAARYDALFEDGPVTRPFVRTDNEHVYHQYSILCERRDELATYLRERGVSTGVYYPVPLHLQRCFAALGYHRGELPVTEEACGRILSLPCHPMMSDDDVDYVAEAVRSFRPAASPKGGPRSGRSEKAGVGQSSAGRAASHR